MIGLVRGVRVNKNLNIPKTLRVTPSSGSVHIRKKLYVFKTII